MTTPRASESQTSRVGALARFVATCRFTHRAHATDLRRLLASSGSGSALISALRQVGATIGVAVLGTVLNSAYRSRLELAGLPAHAAALARQGVAGGIAVARLAGSALLLGSVRTAFVHALDVMLLVCAAIALAAAVLALVPAPPPARPRRRRTRAARERHQHLSLARG